MITQSYPKPGLKILQLPHTPTGPHIQNWKERPNFADTAQAKRIGIEPDEFVRRDRLITKMWAENPWKSGDVARPEREEDFQKYGNCTVLKAYRTYFDFDLPEAREWPKNDYPFVLTVQPEKEHKGEKMFVCTINWLQTKSKTGCAC